ncbi:unnamed protein product [Microthlaspi erraticum]|uniref:3'-5' exonuclease domain-containing protein n=1 Tax=Microthlaspi erraticum TaxID=1685480 RepID=A0A6D2HSE1_9BRAS|nr:unnamed protein product [Microthlaspi erraticum]
MAPTIRTVACYTTHQEHSVDFFGNELLVTVTPTASVISRWIRNVHPYNRGQYSSHPLVVGVGVQWTPFGFHSSPPRETNYYGDPSPGSYNGDAPWNSCYSSPLPANNYADPSPRGEYVDPEADTVQLCVGQRCLIIQLSHCNRVPDELRGFLSDPETIFVGVRNFQDAGKLARSRHQLEIGKLWDIRNFVQDSQGGNMRRCSFEAIVQECMGYHYQGVRLDPEISTSDWSVYNLCDEQILQASLDAYVCAELGVWIRLWEL